MSQGRLLPYVTSSAAGARRRRRQTGVWIRDAAGLPGERSVGVGIGDVLVARDRKRTLGPDRIQGGVVEAAHRDRCIAIRPGGSAVGNDGAVRVEIIEGREADSLLRRGRQRHDAAFVVRRIGRVGILGGDGAGTHGEAAAGTAEPVDQNRAEAE